MLFFDQNDWFTQRKRVRDLETMNKNIEFLTDESRRMEKELRDLQGNPKVLEKYARERYHQKRPNEDVYVIYHDTLPPPKDD